MISFDPFQCGFDLISCGPPRPVIWLAVSAPSSVDTGDSWPRLMVNCSAACLTPVGSDAAGAPPRRPIGASLFDASSVHVPEKSGFVCARAGNGRITAVISADSTRRFVIAFLLEV